MLDCCNSILAGLSATEISRLYRIQNNAVRLVLGKSKRDHISPLPQHLHWLAIPARIDYKIATLAYRHFYGSLPPNLYSTLVIYQPSLSLRSSHEKLLKVPRKNMKAFGHRFCRYQATTVWNLLPSAACQSHSFASFKTNLKPTSL